MSSEYKQLIDRLAKAMNFGGTYVLITTAPEDKEVHLATYGHEDDLATGVLLLIDTINKNITDESVEIFKQAILKEFDKEVERRKEKAVANG